MMYDVTSGERIPLEPPVALVVASHGLPEVDKETFFEEVDRVQRNGDILAIISHDVPLVRFVPGMVKTADSNYDPDNQYTELPNMLRNLVKHGLMKQHWHDSDALAYDGYSAFDLPERIVQRNQYRQVSHKVSGNDIIDGFKQLPMYCRLLRSDRDKAAEVIAQLKKELQNVTGYMMDMPAFELEFHFTLIIASKKET